MKHYPGPWRISENAIFASNDEPVVCDLDTATCDAANERLIAAAPEMLDLLKRLSHSTAILNHLDIETNQELCDLIAKATGVES